MSSRVHAPTAEPFRAEALKRLLGPSRGPCISIYQPTSRRFPEKRQDPTRFRDLVDRARDLLPKGAQHQETESLLAVLRALEGGDHWERSLDGLAVFLSPDLSGAYRLPIPVPERVVVADSFHVKPLIRFLHSNQRYFVLAISQNAVRLYEGSPFGAIPVDVPGVPRDLTDAVGVFERERGVVVHGGGVGGTAFHGRGPSREETKEALLKYFRAIDKGLHEHLRDERTPLLLAAVAYYHPIYREANTYPHLLEAGIDGNFEHVNGDRIHAEAWPIVTREVERRVAAWGEAFGSLAGTGLASDQIDAIAQAVMAGRVRSILAAEGETVWGTLDPSTGALKLHDRQMGPDDDLIDDLCEESLRRGGEVHVVPRMSMPTASPIAAVYRF